MLATDVAFKVRQLIAEHIGIELDEVQPNHVLVVGSPSSKAKIDPANISRRLDLDSLDKVEITMTLEDEFGIEILDSDVEQTQTVQDLIAVVQKGLGIEVQHVPVDDSEGGNTD